MFSGEHLNSIGPPVPVLYREFGTFRDASEGKDSPKNVTNEVHEVAEDEGERRHQPRQCRKHVHG